MRYQTPHGEVGMAIIIHGKKVREFPHTDENTYFWAKNGTEYSVQFWNYTDRRVEVVATVDGLDIIKGRVGDYRTQTGYVIDAHSKPQPIPGFKVNSSTAARFTFGSPEGSYAALMEKPNNIGVIGAAFFVERQRPMPKFDHGLFLNSSGSSPASFGGGMIKGGGATRGASVGTGFGQSTDFHTSKTSFTRDNEHTPTAILSMNYHSQERLAQMGIDIRRRPAVQVASAPNPFPGANEGCPVPPGWNGQRG